MGSRHGNKQRKDKRAHGALYTRVNGERGPFYWLCLYCGEPADTIEHYPPISRIDDYRALGLKHELFVKFPCCGDCNRRAGATLQESVLDRLEFVKDKIARQGARYIAKVEWDDEELEEIGPNLLSKIRENSKKGEIFRRRIEYYAGFDCMVDWLGDEDEP